MLLNVSTLRLTWAVIEEISAEDLLNLNDAMLVRLITQNIANKIMLNSDDVRSLCHYLNSKLLLIRDMAALRKAEAAF